MIRAGALGYVTKTISTPPNCWPRSDRSRRATHTSALGWRRSSSRSSRPPTDRPPPVDDSLSALTPREREVMHHLGRGYAYKRIGARLHLSPRTVESHVGAVLRKLQLTSRHEVTHWAAARGLIEPDDADTT